MNNFSIRNTSGRPVRTQQTRESIINEAERLFVENGFHNTSLRMITEAAEVNLAAVNYHFGNKEALFSAVYERSFIPFLRHYREALNRYDQIPVAEIDLANILEDLLTPTLQSLQTNRASKLTFVRLASAMMFDYYSVLSEDLSDEAHVLLNRFIALISRLNPTQDPQAVEMRVHFALTVIFHSLAGNDIAKLFNKGGLDPLRDPEAIAKELAVFLQYGVMGSAKPSP